LAVFYPMFEHSRSPSPQNLLMKDFCFSKLGKKIRGKETHTFETTDLVTCNLRFCKICTYVYWHVKPLKLYQSLITVMKETLK